MVAGDPDRAQSSSPAAIAKVLLGSGWGSSPNGTYVMAAGDPGRVQPVSPATITKLLLRLGWGPGPNGTSVMAAEDPERAWPGSPAAITKVLLGPGSPAKALTMYFCNGGLGTLGRVRPRSPDRHYKIRIRAMAGDPRP
ncbi:hypothetical protein NDU88_004439 [Pleurodeles waltl]|uniref:Uncharacterized protein n=1 Tax=Pleurodeles waltl TaxID=8319 RepID=A0AAV7PF74_PLEWA|nr:hypothetical protein NDU88_004439 [Pleurodeles waltl]